MAAAFAHPPWGFLPGLLGYALMLHLVDGATPLSAFFRGWLTGCGYFLVSTFWIYEPFQVDAAQQGWMAPIAVVLMAALLALFWGAACLAYQALAGRSAARALLFASALALFEWLRGHVFTGLPWNLPGETWAAGSAMSQGASVVGVYGLTWLTLAIAATPGLGRRWGAIASALVVGLGLWGFGAWRLQNAPVTPVGAPLIRIVQADVKQESKYDQARFAEILNRYVALTARPAARVPDLIIWPEGAIPAAVGEYLAPGTWTRDAITDALKPGQTLMFGGYRFAAEPNGRPVTYNSLLVVRKTPAGLEAAGVYDKYRLVPFGEYMPMDSLASRFGIKAMVHVGDGFTSGPPPRPLELAGLPTVQPLICYESLYSGFSREGARRSGVRAAWIANISNDAWFGTVSGPAQTLNLASYRAIEEGLPMVRATPTGVSALIDAFGRPLRRLQQGAFGVIDAPLPPALAPTLFDFWGETPFWIMLVFSLVGARWKK